jgi:hypothetical protein
VLRLTERLGPAQHYGVYAASLEPVYAAAARAEQAAVYLHVPASLCIAANVYSTCELEGTLAPGDVKSEAALTSSTDQRVLLLRAKVALECTCRCCCRLDRAGSTKQLPTGSGPVIT